jgi:hypothetical protein
MATARLLSLYIRPNPPSTKQEIEDKLDKALDWFRIDVGFYILYTTTEAKIWKERLKPLVEPNGSLLIWLLVPDGYSGWMKRRLWDWVKEKRAKIEKQSEDS